MDNVTECWTCGQMLRLPANPLGMKVLCPTCGAIFLVEDLVGSRPGDRVIGPNELATIPMASDFYPPYECATCQIDLEDRPIIRVEDEIYCYRCAKIEFSRSEEAELARVREVNERLEKQRRVAIDQIDQKVAESRELHSKDTNGNGGCLVFLLLFSALLVFSLVGAREGPEMPVFLPILGLTVIGWIFYFRNKNKADADLQSRLSPIPPYPDATVYEVRNPVRLEIFDRRQDMPKGIPPKDYRKLVLERDGFTCQVCGAKKAPQNLEIHHVKTQACGGDDFLTNLVCLCLSCHDREKWFGHVRRNPTTNQESNKKTRHSNRQ